MLHLAWSHISVVSKALILFEAGIRNAFVLCGYAYATISICSYVKMFLLFYFVLLSYNITHFSREHNGLISELLNQVGPDFMFIRSRTLM